MQRPDATHVMPYGAKDGSTGWPTVGRHVLGPDPVTGEQRAHAIYILRPRFAPDPENDGKWTKLIGFASARVFDISETEGDPIPEHYIHKLEGEAKDALWNALVSFAATIDFTVSITAIPGSANGDTHYHAKAKGGKIRVEESNTDLQQLKTLAHEILHALLHNPYEQHTEYGKLIISNRPLKELEAESGAFIIMGALGYDSGDYSFGYVTNWAAEDPKLAHEGIKASAQRIQHMAKRVLEAIDEKDSEE
jgi:hypothetical protein